MKTIPPNTLHVTKEIVEKIARETPKPSRVRKLFEKLIAHSASAKTVYAEHALVNELNQLPHIQNTIQEKARAKIYVKEQQPKEPFHIIHSTKRGAKKIGSFVAAILLPLPTPVGIQMASVTKTLGNLVHSSVNLRTAQKEGELLPTITAKFNRDPLDKLIANAVHGRKPENPGLPEMPEPPAALPGEGRRGKTTLGSQAVSHQPLPTIPRAGFVDKFYSEVKLHLSGKIPGRS